MLATVRAKAESIRGRFLKKSMFRQLRRAVSVERLKWKGDTGMRRRHFGLTYG
jgi:hypothetical protein